MLEPCEINVYLKCSILERRHTNIFKNTTQVALKTVIVKLQNKRFCIQR